MPALDQLYIFGTPYFMAETDCEGFVMDQRYESCKTIGSLDIDLICYDLSYHSGTH
jgi:hypothetical protein